MNASGTLWEDIWCRFRLWSWPKHSPTAGSSWIRFSDQDGGYRGALRNTDRGAKLESGSGDFAEWQERDPDEEPFGEGDVVAFGENGLTRRTDGAQLLGVISRRAVVTGSMPPESVQEQWDQVAYCGIVPVKLRGGARKTLPEPEPAILATDVVNAAGHAITVASRLRAGPGLQL